MEGRISDDGGRFELAGGMRLQRIVARRTLGVKMTLGIRPDIYLKLAGARRHPLLMDTLECRCR